MPPSKKFYLFRNLVKNAKWLSKSNLPLSHSPDCKIFPFKKDLKKSNFPQKTLDTARNGPYSMWKLFLLYSIAFGVISEFRRFETVLKDFSKNGKNGHFPEFSTLSKRNCCYHFFRFLAIIP